MGDDEDDFDMRDVDVQDRDEVLAIWAQLIQDLRAVHRVCFYPGQHGAAPDFEDFVGALPLIGSCDALVYSEPRLTKIQAWERVGLHRANLQFPIPNLGFATGIDLVQTCWGWIARGCSASRLPWSGFPRKMAICSRLPPPLTTDSGGNTAV